MNKVMANKYRFPRFEYFATLTNRDGTSVPNDGAILYYDPQKPIFCKAPAPDIDAGIADAIYLYSPARPFAPPTNTNAPAIATSNVPRVDSPQRPNTPHEIQPLEPLWNNPDYADWDYEKLKAHCRERKISSVLRNTVQELRNTLIRDDTNLCEGNVREYVDYHTSKKHARVVKYYRRKKAKEAAKAQMNASGSGEHADDAEDEREPGESFGFDIDELVLKTSVAPDIRQQFQEQASGAPGAAQAHNVADQPGEMNLGSNSPSAVRTIPPGQHSMDTARTGAGTLPTVSTQDLQARGDLGANPIHNVADEPEEMDWERTGLSGVTILPPGQHSMSTASNVPGTLPTLPTQDLRAPVAHESKKRSRESSIESIARPVTPPSNEGNIVGRRLAVRPRNQRQQLVSSDSDDEDAFDTLDNLRKQIFTTRTHEPPTQEIRKNKKAFPNHAPPTQKIRKRKATTPNSVPHPQDSDDRGRRTSAILPSPPRGRNRNRNRNTRAQDARRRITRSRESSIDSTISPAHNNNIIVDNSNIVRRFAERRRIKREQRQEEAEVSATDSEDDFEFDNLKDLRKGTA
jgi:hypothetical protein